MAAKVDASNLESNELPPELLKISENLVQNAKTKKYLRMKSFWESQLGAVQISMIKPQLAAHGVNLVAVGLEQLGVEEFLEKKFFDGEVYIDETRQCYKDLQYKKYSICNIFCALCSETTRTALAEARANMIYGNNEGDGFQNGGVLAVAKGGRILLNHVEEEPGDHVPNVIILK